MTNGLQILDVSSPSEPHILAQQYLGEDASCIAACGDTIYLGMSNGAVVILSVAAPLNPKVTSTYLTGSRYVSAIAKSGSFLYVACATGLDIVDLSDPTEPKRAGFFPTPSDSGYSPTDVSVVGKLAFIAAIDLWIVDVSVISNPVQVSRFDTPQSATKIQISDTLV
ncbi:MAG TPA: hypothetical protein VMS71_03130, partial [Candidatus Acidoferrum sp.]|nr:hypothetical protein [Candidatus Acidoferrum sp.]